jgi:Arc/MetJ-type ribon-helix-helix transcriptional regulator
MSAAGGLPGHPGKGAGKRHIKKSTWNEASFIIEVIDKEVVMVTLKSLVQAGLYPNEDAALEEALRVLWQERPQLRLDWAVYQYRSGELSLAGVSFDRMKENLVQRGIQPRLGPANLDEAQAEVSEIEKSLGS